MSTSVSLAIDRYDRHFPFFDGTLTLPKGLSLDIFQAGETSSERDGAHRHQRMLKEGEFDAAEVSFSSFLMAKARGLPFTAIPAFPRRLFSQTQMYVKANTNLKDPQSLSGKRIGLQSFQTTLAVLAKGDLAHEYGVDLKTIQWVTGSNETVGFTPKPGWNIRCAPENLNLNSMLEEGKIDALFFSRVPPALESGSVRRLFPDPKKACTNYFKRNGFFPIMHVIAIKDEVIASITDLPLQLLELYQNAKLISSKYLEDPGWSQLAWASLALEDENNFLNHDVWPVGLSDNRLNIERFILYSFEQGLINRRLEPEELFHESVRSS